VVFRVGEEIENLCFFRFSRENNERLNELLATRTRRAALESRWKFWPHSDTLLLALLVIFFYVF
jgi:hypothetical protein